jgi:hypothetical protein
MARTIEQIKTQLITAYFSETRIQEAYEVNDINDPEQLPAEDSFESILFYVIAFCIHTLERIFDVHKSEVTDIINRTKPHSAQWYAEMARAYQDGFDLLPDGSGFDNTGHSEADILASKTIKYSAAIEQRNGLQIKVAKIVNGDMAKPEAEELDKFQYYMNKIKDAGVHIDILSGDAHLLKLNLTVYYNPLVLTADGNRVDGTANNVIKEAIKAYLNSIKFDGTLIIAHLIDALQQVDGVLIPHINTGNPAPDYGIAYRYGDIEWVPIGVKHQPDSGYIRLDNDALTITYIPQ